MATIVKDKLVSSVVVDDVLNLHLVDYVLVIDDDIDFTDVLIGSLARRMPNITWGCINDPLQIEGSINNGSDNVPLVVVLDLVLNTFVGVESGFRVLKMLTSVYPNTRVIVLTGHGSSEFGVRAMSAGAAAFLQKPPDIDHLVALITDCLNQAKIRHEIDLLRNERLNSLANCLIGDSQCMRHVREQVLFAASHSQPVLITGETGTGKGECALAIHRFSARSSGRFVRYQPVTGSLDLITSELFGHSRGSFTGATGSRKGLIEEAHAGTLFLDEIDEFNIATQVALLGVLQEKKIRPIGENREIAVDFRLICASNADLAEAQQIGKLRSDFYHRLAHFVIQLKPLRERQEDIIALAQSALDKLYQRGEMRRLTLSPDACDFLLNHLWPGNVRELLATIENTAYRVSFDGKEYIRGSDISLLSSSARSERKVIMPGTLIEQHQRRGLKEMLDDYRSQIIKETLNRNNGNISRTALDLGLDRTSLKRLMRKVYK
jgi:DNA-binding NtrC family response regulator